MTMEVDERHRRLHRKLEEVLGSEEAGTLMEGLTRPRFETELLRRDIQALESRMEGRFSEFESRMDAKIAQLEARFLDKMNDQTKTLFRTFLVSNAAMILAVATLAFGAARLG
jgi:hypothetical protein